MDWEYIINDYLKWIKDNTFIEEVDRNNLAKISVPFLDRHNDQVEVYVKKIDNNKFLLTDDGFTLNDLNQSGVDLNSPKRDQIFRTIVNGFGVKMGEDSSLFIEATRDNLGQKKHYLIQAILAVGDMYSLSQESVFSLFKEDVENYFKAENILFSKDIKVTGKSGFDHNIDFLIPASRVIHERLIKTINIPDKYHIGNAIFSFTDIAQNREDPIDNIVIYNDTERLASTDIVDALHNYSILGVPWSKRHEYKERFSLIN